MKAYKGLIYVILTITMAAALGGCDKLDDDRIPPAAVNISFATEDMWRLYGVPATPDYRYFIKSERVPAGYPYAALTQTGFGGVLLVADVHNEPVAFDLACPVEARSDVRIAVDPQKADAYCPKCHSRYSIYTNGGIPTSGPALEDNYALRRYVVRTGIAGEYRLVTP